MTIILGAAKAPGSGAMGQEDHVVFWSFKLESYLGGLFHYCLFINKKEHTGTMLST